MFIIIIIVVVVVVVVVDCTTRCNHTCMEIYGRLNFWKLWRKDTFSHVFFFLLFGQGTLHVKCGSRLNGQLQ